MRNNLRSGLCIPLAFCIAWQPAFPQYQAALPGYHFEFPRDYFDHPDYQTEWWYYTGNLQSTDGHKFGFELTFFRQGVSRAASTASAWDLRDLYLAHFAVSDLDGKKFFYTERTNRSGPGIAGADASQQKVWNGNWSVVWKDGHQNLQALADQFAVSLSLQPQKPPVIHGENGISRKSTGTGHASHYFSETRLRTSGTLEISARKYEVAGTSWMDHEFFTEQLDASEAGWDWLSVQLDDNTELMLFHIRKKDGTIDPFSAGTFVDVQGRAHKLAANDFQLFPAGEIWKSPSTQADYPIRWNIRVPSLNLALECFTALPSQELAGDSQIIPSYWEGSIFLNGTKNRVPLHGTGYLEMTGYQRPLNMK